MFDKITICIPYFERLGPLEKTLDGFHSFGYFNDNIHLCLVDDGSINEPIPRSYDSQPWCTVVRLPKKKERKNASVPVNVAVKHAKGPIILLQSPETYHTKPIIREMAESIKGHKDIVLAAVSSDRKGVPWYAHPKHRPVKFWFCQMMTKQFFGEIGGFDEDYRDGLGFEDDDFINRLDAANANWIWRADCVAHHPFVPGVTGTIPGSHDPNQKVYRKKWRTP